MVRANKPVRAVVRKGGKSPLDFVTLVTTTLTLELRTDLLNPKLP